MKAARQPVYDEPREPTDAEIELRVKLIAEEFYELLEAIYPGFSKTPYGINMRSAVNALEYLKPGTFTEEVADALADISYVVEGAAQTFGYNSSRVGTEVHAANMRKFNEGAWIREDGKQMKPPDWQPPDISKAIREQNDFKRVNQYMCRTAVCHVRGFEVRVGDVSSDVGMFYGQGPSNCTHRKLVDNIIDHATDPIDYIEVLMHQVLVHHRGSVETVVFEVP